jgi:hypothetical protein
MRTHKLILFVLSLAFVSLFCAEADDRPEVSAKAVSVESPNFLKPPPGLDTTDLVIAQTAPKVEVCMFAGLENRGKGTLWSSWGDGCVARSGKYYTSIGDHLGANATSYVYEYNPLTKVMRRVVDVLEAIMHMLGLYGHGKIHAGIHEAADGTLYFATYWGKPKEIDAAFTKGFNGSILLRYNPQTGRTENLGAIAPKQGLPASNFDSRRQLLYFHAVYEGDITVYDIAKGKVRFHGGRDESGARRTFLPGDNGRMYLSGNDGTLLYFDPEKNELAKTGAKLPINPGAKKDNTLRAAAQRPAKDGTCYGMTAAGRLFAFDPKTENVKDLGPNILGGDYTAVMAISPDDKYLYYAPGAHGSGKKHGAAVVQYEIATGRRKAIAFLQQPLLDQLKWQIGGTYNLQLDSKGETLYCTFNGSQPGARSAFGVPAAVMVHIPPSERP